MQSFGTVERGVNIQSFWSFFESTTSNSDELMTDQEYPSFSSIDELLNEQPNKMKVKSSAI
jgi:hypothetical protein